MISKISRENAEHVVVLKYARHKTNANFSIMVAQVLWLKCHPKSCPQVKQWRPVGTFTNLKHPMTDYLGAPLHYEEVDDDQISETAPRSAHNDERIDGMEEMDDRHSHRRSP